MYMMFNQTGSNATTWSIGHLCNWNTSKVTNMNSMFYNAGRNATWLFRLQQLECWQSNKLF